MDIEPLASTTTRSGDRPAGTFSRMATRGSVSVIFGTARRLYLLTICAITLVPGFVAPLTVLVAAGGRVAVVGGVPRFVESSPAFGVILAVSAVTAIASGLAALAGGARLVLDFIDGRPLSARLAVTAVLRRPRTFAMLVILFVTAVVVLVAIGAGVRGLGAVRRPGGDRGDGGRRHLAAADDRVGRTDRPRRLAGRRGLDE
ncbi:hypothetical protein AB0O28_30920 [Microbispora sp. NPDC088329]|uniref:hypothetical protein n=1 Tax=Microbispora sp. NPDC088329 TaxID=3154869 RepID=UPI0034190B33